MHATLFLLSMIDPRLAVSQLRRNCRVRHRDCNWIAKISRWHTAAPVGEHISRYLTKYLSPFISARRAFKGKLTSKVVDPAESRTPVSRTFIKLP